MMAFRTTTTRTTSFEPAPFADKAIATHATFSFYDLVQAYYDCRRTKRNTKSAIAFEIHMERNLAALYDELIAGTYQPGTSICFAITHPKPREVWAAGFRDRIVHHLLYNHVAPRAEASFIADSCACIPGRGTLYAAKRLEHKIRSITENWSKPAYYLKCDLANFFVSIPKKVLQRQLVGYITDPWWSALAETILFHDPRADYLLRGNPEHLERVPAHKRLINQSSEFGLPIGNLSSQFFANVFLNDLDQFAKHQLRAHHYIRYVDDFIFLHESPDWLNAALARVTAFLPDRLGVQLNPTKTILQPVDRGVDFVGHVIKPWCRSTRRRTVNQAVQRVAAIDAADLMPTANSFFGLFRQAHASRVDCARLARMILRRGSAVSFDLTKTYRGKNA